MDKEGDIQSYTPTAATDQTTDEQSRRGLALVPRIMVVVAAVVLAV